MTERQERQPGTDEDVRAAAGIQVTICTFVMTAGLAIIAGATALTTYYLQFRYVETLTVSLLMIVISVAVAGFVVGGKALQKLSVSGYHGNWRIFDTSHLFDAQALLTLLSVLLFILSFVFVVRAPIASQNDQASNLATRLTRAERDLATLRASINSLAKCRQVPVAPAAARVRPRQNC
jgi:magnesium-transporting ATPase (P-type)